jgi:hypothetical protein
MKKHDRENLKYLMTISQQKFEEWLDNASQDDVEYALELIRMAKAENIVEWIELSEVSESDDYSEANAVIDSVKQKLKGTK